MLENLTDLINFKENDLHESLQKTQFYSNPASFIVFYLLHQTTH